MTTLKQASLNCRKFIAQTARESNLSPITVSNAEIPIKEGVDILPPKEYSSEALKIAYKFGLGDVLKEIEKERHEIAQQLQNLYELGERKVQGLFYRLAEIDKQRESILDPFEEMTSKPLIEGSKRELDLVKVLDGWKAAGYEVQEIRVYLDQLLQTKKTANSAPTPMEEIAV